MLRLAVGATVDCSRLFSTGYGGSQTRLGPRLTSGQEGYLGFKFTKNNATGPYYGWMRVVFTGNTIGPIIKDWAYDNGGSAIVTGRVLQSAPSENAQVVTLSPGTGETFTLGSAITNTGGNINSLVKTGAGTATLVTTNSYTGGTTVNGGVLVFAASQNLTALTIGASAVVTLTNATPALDLFDDTEANVVDFDSDVAAKSGGEWSMEGGIDDGIVASNQVPSVPEPGSIGLLLIGVLGMLGRRRRATKAAHANSPRGNHSTVSSPLTGISAGGVATASIVFQDTAAGRSHSIKFATSLAGVSTRKPSPSALNATPARRELSLTLRRARRNFIE